MNWAAYTKYKAQPNITRLIKATKTLFYAWFRNACLQIPTVLASITHSTERLTHLRSPDLVASLHSDPLRNGPVLFLLLGEEALDLECLVGRLKTRSTVNNHVNKIFLSYIMCPRFQSQALHTFRNTYDGSLQLACVTPQSRYRLASFNTLICS